MWNNSKSPNRYRPSPGAKTSIALFNLAGRIALSMFEKKTRNAVRANQDALAKILKLNETTVFGQAHRFGSINASDDRIAAFKDAVPLTRFADYSDYIDRIAKGQHNVLTRDTVDVLAGSSGTTDVVKRLPNTKRARRKFMFFVPLVQQGVLAREIAGATSAQRGINLMSLYTPPPEKGANQPLMSANNAAMDSVRKQIPVMWSSPEAVFGIGHQPTAFYLHALFGLIDRDALYITAVFAPHLASFFTLMEKYRNQLVRDIETGAVAGHLMLSRAARESIESRLEPDPARAKALRAEFDKGLEDIVPRIWPNMKYVVAVTTGSFSIYMPRLKSLIGENIRIYTPCHASSEAIIGMNLRPGQDDYVLALGSAYFEFIPLAHSNEDQRATLSLNELQVGREYEIVLTSFAGLYRYRLEDIVRVTGFRGTAPRFEFLYRKGAILNLVGEKTTEYHTAKAVTACIAQWLGSAGHLQDYSVASQSTNGVSNYAFYVELEASIWPPKDKAQDIAKRLDRELCKANDYYWSNGRKADALGPVRINFVEPGTFAALTRMQDRNSDATVSSQIKTPRVINRADQLAFLEDAVFLSVVGQDSEFQPDTVTGAIQDRVATGL